MRFSQRLLSNQIAQQSNCYAIRLHGKGLNDDLAAVKNNLYSEESVKTTRKIFEKYQPDKE